MYKGVNDVNGVNGVNGLSDVDCTKWILIYSDDSSQVDLGFRLTSIF